MIGPRPARDRFDNLHLALFLLCSGAFCVRDRLTQRAEAKRAETLAECLLKNTAMR